MVTSIYSDDDLYAQVDGLDSLGKKARSRGEKGDGIELSWELRVREEARKGKTVGKRPACERNSSSVVIEELR